MTNKVLSLLLLAGLSPLAPSARVVAAPAFAHSPNVGIWAVVSEKDNGKISGTIVDAASKQPIPYTTIALIDPLSGKPVDGTIADDAGKFSLEKITHGEYRLQFSFIGYQTKTLEKVVVGDKRIELGEILLSESEEVLNAVTIEGQRPMIEERVDRTVYNAEDDASNRGGDATDVLRKVPMLSVDLDGNVSMRGSGNIRVLINNRPSTITAGSVADALKQIPADMIKSVEVITSPSAKYDAEGSAGIINIITKKNTLQGGTLNIDTGIGLRGSNLGLNGSYRTGKMGFSLGGFGRAGYNMPGSFENALTTRRGEDEQLIRQSATTDNRMMFGRYTLGWDYDINEKNYLNASVQYGLRNGSNRQNSLLSERFWNGELFSSELRNVETSDNSGTVDVNFNYTRSFSKPQQELSLLTQFSRNNRNNDLFFAIFNPDAQSIAERQKNSNESFNQESTVQLDYQTPLGKMQMLEVGAKQILRQVTSDYQTFAAQGTDPFVLKEGTNLSNVFNYDQNISAGYLSYTVTTASKYSLKAGTRYEYTTITANFENSDREVILDPYGVLVPSVNLSKSFKGGSAIKLAYNRRIQRPSLQFLNPNAQNPDPTIRRVGNPELDPEFTNNFELGYSTYFKTTSLNLTTYVRSTNNSIQTVRNRAEDGALETSFFNIGQESAYGASLFGGSSLFGKKLTLNGGTDFYYADLANNVADPDQRAANSGWVVNLRAFGNYSLGKGWGLQGFGFYRSGQVQLQGYQGGFGIYSLNLRKEFHEKRGTIGFGAENFLGRTIRIQNEVNSPSFSQQSTNVMHNLNFKVNVSYRLGKMSMDGPRRRRKSINNDDMKSGGEGMQDAGSPAAAPQGGAPRTGAAPQFARPVQPSAPGPAADSAAVAEVNPNGRWQGSLGQMQLTLNLQAEGETLSGTVETPMGAQPIADGKISGNELSFTITFRGMSIPYAGRIVGDTLYLAFNVQGRDIEGSLQRVVE
ncbi:TonB-dependent receptor domain-containing protein [Cesiribacter andamanensis]|uniref:Outer membrane cobalamin receptor protein n=1 Tax=Cesiribacter andamanensis AMV16 TaxID=1279009 RepID=M7NNJ4_9BACT|nr:TonB-dependent receptor [Cesiribacter andamanensis]EMR03270.1 Outer membrane cobalamin receptor protein [Cesiribacter andamanensis AMV16]